MKKEKLFNKKAFEEWLFVNKGIKEDEIELNSTREMLFHEYAEDDEDIDLEEIERLNNLSKEEKEKDLI